LEKLYYSYDLFKEDTQKLVNSCRDYEPDVLLAVARGGLTLAHLMAQALDMRNLYTLNSIHYEGELKLGCDDSIGKTFFIEVLSLFNSKRMIRSGEKPL